VIFFGAGFFTGKTMNKNNGIDFASAGNNMKVGNQVKVGGRLGGAGQGMAQGEVISIGDNSITLKTMNGGSKVILFSDDTVFKKSTEASLDDLVVGKNILVSGKSGTDGNIVADSVDIR